MIDIKKAEEEFIKYTNNYNLSEIRLYRKVTHTFRVVEISGKIARLLDMSDEEINLAKLIGLLHDIARFEQYTNYQTFNDYESFDHGDFAVKILKKDNFIRKFIQIDKYDEIIFKAIENHNKYSIDPNIAGKERVFCEIIRDADKIDIMYQATCESWRNNIEDMNTQMINQKAIEQFNEESVVEKRCINNDIDKIIVICAFIYDLNVKESYKIIKENDYINKMLDRFDFKNDETKNQIEKVRKIANNYIEKRV